METQGGIEVTVLVLEPETKDILFKLRNRYIAAGETFMTTGDVVTKAVNCLAEFEKMQDAASRRKDQQNEHRAGPGS